MSKPVISICVPVYNGEKYLEACLESLVKQEVSVPYEILIIDDQSTDHSPRICHNYATRYPDIIRVNRNEINLGLTGNWNQCLQHALGEWIYLFFQDDIMKAGSVETLYRSAIKDNCLFALCDREYMLEHATEWRKQHLTHTLPRLSDARLEGKTNKGVILKQLETYLLKYNFIGEPICGLFHRSLVDELGPFDEKLTQAVDFEFWLRLSLNTSFSFVPEKLVSFRVHQESQTERNRNSSMDNIYLKDRLIICEKFLTHPVYSGNLNTDEFEVLRKVVKGQLFVMLKKYGHSALNRNSAELVAVRKLQSKILQQNPVLYFYFLKKAIRALFS